MTRTPGTRVDRAAEWIYRGLWGMLVDLFRVPAEGPTLPVQAGDRLERFHPAQGFLRWLKFYFWLVLVASDGVLFICWVVLCVNVPEVGLLLAPVFVAVAVLPDLVAYVAIHLRYDTTWYVMTDRSLRIRRGVWVVNEVSITFENVQNVKVSQGPIQRAFGIANVLVETAGAGQPSDHTTATVSNRGLIEGICDAPRIRDRIMTAVRRSKTAGLGDEALPQHAAEARSSVWSAEHLKLLAEIRDEVVGLRKSGLIVGG